MGHKACRDDRSVLYQRPNLFGDLQLARGDGRYGRLFRALAGVQLLIQDHWGLEPLTAEARHDLLEIFGERCARRSATVNSQLPVEKYEVIGIPYDVVDVSSKR
ncbi:IstB-like ATP binding protein [Bradyrhizobium sp. Rc3b]|uniref:ATP-binding protein n=1 Tax=Bradyrhizobium sp. Rc3b TaxID=1855322 RepID=UPI0008F21239|nr:ATP-binding protein [Bradyrhizobium sp. Rc3b]SFN96454.1 IstB-like ATP binding protein [Bradyrhizobium sp. Rc3b]